VHGFYWLIDGVLAGSPCPGGWPIRGAEAEPVPALDADLTWLRGQGIGAILSLTEASLPASALARHDLTWQHLPVDDLRAPSPEQLLAALAFIDRARLQGRRVAVHCRVGQGRTGTILAAYLIRGGIGADAALQRVRAVCPGAVGSPEQEQALGRFAQDRDWLV